MLVFGVCVVNERYYVLCGHLQGDNDVRNKLGCITNYPFEFCFDTLTFSEKSPKYQFPKIMTSVVICKTKLSSDIAHVGSLSEIKIKQ